MVAANPLLKFIGVQRFSAAVMALKYVARVSGKAPALVYVMRGSAMSLPFRLKENRTVISIPGFASLLAGGIQQRRSSLKMATTV